MESLRKIESLPATRRSSFIGQAGVISDLRALRHADATTWLERHLASPVSKDWGQLLYALGADGSTLTRWFGLGKEFALAAADAAVAYAESGEADLVLHALPALRSAAAAYDTPRLQAALRVFEQAAKGGNGASLSAALQRAQMLLSNGQGLASAATAAVAAAPDHPAKWHALLHALDRTYCVAILDSKCTVQDQIAALHSLPIWSAQAVGGPLQVASADIGSDELILIALSAAQMHEISGLAAPLRLSEHRVAA